MNVYIWKEYNREPWANTLLYLPLNSTDTYTNKSSSWISTTNSWVSFGTYQWVDCWYFAWGEQYIQSWAYSLTDFTVAVWIYPDFSTGAKYIFTKSWALKFHNWAVLTTNSMAQLWVAVSSTSISIIRQVNNIQLSKWALYVGTKSWGTYKLYIFNWDTPVVISSSQYDATSSSWNMYIWKATTSWYSWQWWMSKFIEESVAWSEQDIIDYYNWTKSTYWL